MCCGKAAVTAAPKNKTAGTNSNRESKLAELICFLPTAFCLLPSVLPTFAADRRLAAQY